MRTRRLLCILAATSGLAAPAAARVAGCGQVRARAVAGAHGSTVVGWGFEAGRRVYFTVGRARVDLAGSARCEAESADADADFACRWTYARYAEAAAAYDALLDRVRLCTIAPVAENDEMASGPDRRVMRQNGQRFEGRPLDTLVQLGLVEHAPAPAPAPAAAAAGQAAPALPPVQYIVDLAVSREDHEDDEDEDDD